MARHLMWLLVLGVFVSACRLGDEETPEAESADGSTTTHSAAVAEDVAPYKLEVEMLGLIAFVESGGDIFALLPDAKYDPASVGENDLPPNAFSELQAVPSSFSARLHTEYPPHIAKMRFTNATVTSQGVETQDPVFDLQGKDIEFLDLPVAEAHDLDLLASASDMIDTTTLTADEQTKLGALDRIDPVLLGTSLDPRLAARVKVNFGMVQARENSQCSDRKFTFQKPSSLGCGAKPPQPLAEEVVAKVENLQSSFRVKLGPSDELVVRPTVAGLPLKIEVLNQVEHGQVLDCDDDFDHLESFRWFYRLNELPADLPVDLHLYPCGDQEVFGGNKCPQKLLLQ